MVSPLNSDGVVGDHQRADQHRRDHPHQREAPVQRGHPAAEEHGQAEEDHRRGPVGRAQRQAGRGVGHEGLEHAADGGRVGVGERPDREDHADHDQQDEVRALPPAQERGHDDGQHGHGVRGDQQPDVLGEADGGLGPRAEVVGAVEVPVAEAPEHLRGVRGGRRRRDRLGVLEHVDAVAGLDHQPGDPPQAGEQAEHADAQRGQHGLAPGRLAQDDHGVEDPQDRGDADVDDGGGVDAADERDARGRRGLACASRRAVPPGS